VDVVFFFQAEDGIRDFHVTGVQTCALPIWRAARRAPGVLLRAAPAGAVRLQAERPARHHPGVRAQAQGDGVPARPAAHVGVLHRPGQAPRRAAPAPRGPEPGAAARHEGRGVRAAVPADDRGPGVRTVVVTNPPRADAAAVGALAGFGVATVHEAMGRTGYLGPSIRPVHLGSRIGGTAVTVL